MSVNEIAKPTLDTLDSRADTHTIAQTLAKVINKAPDLWWTRTDKVTTYLVNDKAPLLQTYSRVSTLRWNQSYYHLGVMIQQEADNVYMEAYKLRAGAQLIHFLKKTPIKAPLALHQYKCWLKPLPLHLGSQSLTTPSYKKGPPTYWDTNSKWKLLILGKKG